MPAAPMPVPMHIVTMPYFCFLPPHPVHDRRRADRAGRAERMPQRDGAAERIDLRRIDVRGP